MKKIVTVLLWLLVVTNLVTIYHFSDQPAKKSSSTSHSVTKKITKPLTKNKSPKEKKKIEEKWNDRLRTIAHFSMFFLLGLFLMSAMMTSFSHRKSLVYLFVLTLILVLIYALSDEYHQSFIPGRSAQFIDIVVDFSGGLIASGILFIIFKFKKKKSM